MYVPATLWLCRQQNVDWVRLGVSKAVFVDQLVAPLAAWAWDGSRMALDLQRFNFGPEQGSMVSQGCSLAGGWRIIQN